MQQGANHRPFFLIGAALALPIVVLVVLQISFALSREREEVERLALARAEQTMTLSMARIEADFALMRVLATADAFELQRWPEAYTRAREVAALNPHWRNVVVSDLQRREQVFELRSPYGRRAPLSAEVAALPPGFQRGIGGAVREGAGCPCVHLHAMLPSGGGRYLLTVALDPAAFRDILVQRAPPGAIAAIVDREGDFIARTADHEQRVGTPATRFVRAAIRSGRASGLYVGTTYEGFENYTSYWTAPQSGWSAHIAVASDLIDRPRALSLIASALGGLAALAIAGGLIALALRDIAQRRAAEQRLAQTQKLEAIGQLTGGMAHDFNNLLTVMIGGVNMLLRRSDDPKQREIAEHMLEAAKRGERLTKQLLAFSRGQQIELTAVDLAQLAPGMEELLRRSIDPDTTLEIGVDDDARWVRSDANQLELAILNLVINARDAMPAGGRIAIRARASEKPGFVELSVADTGIGMDKEVAARALEPFFTTKPAGKGTGLGLSQVYGAARQSGGHVEIESAPGHGTIVRLLLPRAEPLAGAAATESDRAAERTAPRVLVVDDEPGVRGFMAEALREAGFDAIEAEDAGAALRLIEAAPPDLLLTDYSMPGMSGLELAERARKRDARVRVLIVSGYADAATLARSEARPALLRKPFDERALLDAVRGLLAAA